MKRRDFIGGLVGVAAAWPQASRAQAPMPVIGFLNPLSPAPTAHLQAEIRKALSDAGFEEGRNVAFEFRWGHGQYERLPAMAADLVQRRVAMIVASPTVAAVAAKAASPTIPIVFSGTDDPVKLGLVASIARPGGNVTGVHFLLSDLVEKQLGLMRELVPSARRIGLLVNPHNPNAEAVKKEVSGIASGLGISVDIVQASNERELEASFAALARKVDALLVAADPFFFGQRTKLTALAAHHAIPAVFNVREYAEAGGLLTYGTSLTEVYRQVGNYIGRILKGAAPADLPVVQSTKFELIVNLKTAKALGVKISDNLLSLADEVIE